MNVAEKLAREIARVAAIRQQYADLDEKNLLRANFKPAIFMMDQSLDAAMKAAGIDDAIEQMRALADLEGFTG